VAENYPNLKANENFKSLQEELAGTENKISYIRTAYNDSVLEYDTAIKVFPNVLLVGVLGFGPKPYFETAEAERAPVKVSFEEKAPEMDLSEEEPAQKPKAKKK
jgi:LemA protein